MALIRLFLLRNKILEGDSDQDCGRSIYLNPLSPGFDQIPDNLPVPAVEGEKALNPSGPMTYEMSHVDCS